MALTTTKTVEVDGEEKEVEVEIDPSDHGYLSRDEHKEVVSDERSKVRNAEREKARGKISLDQIGEDEELQEELQERYPDLFRASDNGDSGEGDDVVPQDRVDEMLEKRKQAWKREELDPVQDKAESLEEEARQLRTEKLHREVVEAATDAGFRDDPGVRRGLKLIARDEMGYSEEDAEWYREGEDGFEISAEGGDSRYVTVREFLNGLAGSGDYDSWLQSSTREGPGYGGSEGGGDVPPNTTKSDMSEQDKMDFIEEHGLEAWEDLPVA